MLTASLGEKGAGVQSVVRGLATNLSTAADIRVYGGASGEGGPGFRPLRVVGPAAFGFLPGLGRALEADELDVLHTHGLWMYPSVASVRWSRGRRPYVVSPHGMLDPWALRNSARKKKLAGYAYENGHLHGAACLHALNEAEASAIRSYGLSNPICIIPNGVDLPPETGLIERNGKVCLYLGRLHPKKGISSLLRAWAKARSHGWRLVVAGWGQSAHEREFRDLARDLNLNSSVDFIGPRFGADKASCFQSASAFILPSLSEGLPVAVLEAWSYGLPVAITPECNLPEGYAEGAALRLESNEDGIAAGLSLLFNLGEAQLRGMGVRGRRLVERQFTWQRVTAQFLAVYKWLLNAGPIPDCVRLP